MKRIVLRDRAARDIAEVVDHYGAEAGDPVAVDFVDVLEEALVYIGRSPATGSPRHAHELDLPGLRSWPLRRYPYLVFYFERTDHVDVWRVLHTRRHIPEHLR